MTSTGVELSVVLPSPSWPTLFKPQHLTPPALVTAQVWSDPASIDTNVTGAGAMVVVDEVELVVVVVVVVAVVGGVGSGAIATGCLRAIARYSFTVMTGSQRPFLHSRT